jgi:hypothetical protein
VPSICFVTNAQENLRNRGTGAKPLIACFLWVSGLQMAPKVLQNRRGRGRRKASDVVVETAEEFETLDTPDETIDKLARELDDEDTDPEIDGWVGDCEGE